MSDFDLLARKKAMASLGTIPAPEGVMLTGEPEAIKPGVDVEVGEAQMKPAGGDVKVDVGEAKMKPPADVKVDVGEAKMKAPPASDIKVDVGEARMVEPPPVGMMLTGEPEAIKPPQGMMLTGEPEILKRKALAGLRQPR